MAKRKNLLGMGGLSDAADNFVIGMAKKMGIYDADKIAAAEQARQDKMRAEQQRAFEAGMRDADRARREGSAIVPTENRVAVPGMPPEQAGQTLSPEQQALQALAAQAQAAQAGVPPDALSDPAGIQSLLGLDPPNMEAGQDATDYGGFPAPIMSAPQRAAEYVTQFEGVPLSPEGQKDLLRLKQYVNQMQSGDLMPNQVEELAQQFEKEKLKTNLESKVETPPTVESEASTRVAEGPSGMQTIMQPDGRLDTKDPTTKAQIKEMEIAAQERQSQLQAEQQARQQAEQERTHISEIRMKARQERQQKMAEYAQREREVRAKEAEERTARQREYTAAQLEKKDWGKRYEEASKELSAKHKELNPKLPARQFTQQEIAAYAQWKMHQGFLREDAAKNPSVLSRQPKLSPEARLKQMQREDPAGFNQMVTDKLDELNAEFAASDAGRSGEIPGPSRADAIRSLLAETPEAVEAELEAVLGGGAPEPPARTLSDVFAEGRPATPEEAAPILQRLFAPVQQPAQQSAPAPHNPLRDEPLPDGPAPITEDVFDVTGPSPDELRQSLANEFGITPEEVEPELVQQATQQAYTQAFNDKLVGTLANIRTDSKPIQEAEAALKESLGRDVDLGAIIDPSVLKRLTDESGDTRKSIEELAGQIAKATKEGRPNLNTASRMVKDRMVAYVPQEGVHDISQLKEKDFYLDKYGTVQRVKSKRKPAPEPSGNKPPASRIDAIGSTF